ncbi:CRBA2 protein, partial [Corythaeola cristata]|nr:CRBA2 protein [Corythaeola cristata]
TSSEAMDTLGQYKITVWEEESFQGKRCEFLMEYPHALHQSQAWSQAFHSALACVPFDDTSPAPAEATPALLTPSPLPPQNHNDSKAILYEAENFQGHKFELSDDYPSLQAMGWGNKEVASIKVNAGAWVAYQYPGYRGYQYVLERDRQNGEFKKYNEYSSQAHTNQIQSIRRVQH